MSHKRSLSPVEAPAGWTRTCGLQRHFGKHWPRMVEVGHVRPTQQTRAFKQEVCQCTMRVCCARCACKTRQALRWQRAPSRATLQAQTPGGPSYLPACARSTAGNRAVQSAHGLSASAQHPALSYPRSRLCWRQTGMNKGAGQADWPVCEGWAEAVHVRLISIRGALSTTPDPDRWWCDRQCCRAREERRGKAFALLAAE